ncbi:MAG TPA: hypothetical protein PLJ04_00965 [Candidatus Saccharibacteria bacterium]|nr:hypothetical protein [Candidatus Saccharibacteria bacterium]MCB9817455.1 hypothetical protein [Candidatus Nomurabacteria bacterium]HPD99423.1 hypothetical protein [Candidatus Saccharibacteria bacterium]HPR10128.1 hypothetical protein [Candidatus Saccharibacteria bacterium]
MKIHKHIEIVSSSLPVLSSMSERSRNAIQKTLQKHYLHVGITLIDTPNDLKKLIKRKPDLVFLGMKFVPEVSSMVHNEPIKYWISEHLDIHGIPYTGSSKRAHIQELNKDIAKDLMLEADISTAKYYVGKRGMPATWQNNNLKYPVFIKPANRGGGIGIDDFSIAYGQAAINAKVRSVTNSLQSDVLVEEFLSGQEYSVAIMRKPDSDGYDSLAIELSTQQEGTDVSFISSNIKEANSEVVLTVDDLAVNQQVSQLALDAFVALGARDYGRIDIRLDEHGVPHFLEANLLPSLIEDYGSFPKACKLNAHIDYESMILNIVDLAFTRTAKTPELVLQNI